MNHQAEIDLLVQAHAGEKELAQERSLKVLSVAKSSNSSHCFIAGPWELVEGSDEGNAVISPPMILPYGDDPWWTAIVICTDRETQNGVARMMTAAPDLLAACKMQMERLQARLPKDTYATVDEWIDAALVAPASTQIRKDAEAANAIRAAISRATGETP